MSRPDESAAQTSTKLVLPSGQKIPLASLGFQGGSFITLILLAWLGQGTVERFIDEAAETREAVELLGERLDKVDNAIEKLSENAAQIERLSSDLAEVRATNARLATELAATSACARDKRKC